MTVTSTSARLSRFAANSPPKPDPMMTTWCRGDMVAVIDDLLLRWNLH
jgi:hypothetical protein